MDDLHHAFLRSVVDARLADAADRRRARDAAVERRATHRAARDESASPLRRWPWPWPWPWRHPARLEHPAPDRALSAVAPPSSVSVEVELGRLLEELVERAAEFGTRPQRRMLAELATATRSVAPGAAAALLDHYGSEVSRLRAIGVLHGVALRGLSAAQQAELLDRLRGGTSRTRALVA